MIDFDWSFRNKGLTAFGNLTVPERKAAGFARLIFTPGRSKAVTALPRVQFLPRAAGSSNEHLFGKIVVQNSTGYK